MFWMLLENVPAECGLKASGTCSSRFVLQGGRSIYRYSGTEDFEAWVLYFYRRERDYEQHLYL